MTKQQSVVKLYCTRCDEELDKEEAESPRTDEDGEKICDECYEEEYETMCPACGQMVEKAECNKYFIIDSKAARYFHVLPGYYKILRNPFYADGIIEMHLYTWNIQRLGPLKGNECCITQKYQSGPICEYCADHYIQGKELDFEEMIAFRSLMR